MSDTQNIPKKWKPTVAQREVLEELAALVEKEGSQAEFQKKHCSFGITKLSRILAALNPGEGTTYFDDVADPEAVIIEMEDLIEQVNGEEDRSERTDVSDVRKTTHLRAIVQAVKEAKNKKGPERLVKYLAPTGGGKSIVCNHLKSDQGARVVEAREAWKRSYFTFLEDVCGALRIRLAGENRPSTIEKKMIGSLRGKTIVLVIDEGEFFGASALNGIKLLLNKTKLVIVVCAIPEAHDKWNRHFATEAEQISRRTHAIVELGTIVPADCALFFSSKQFSNDKEAHKYIADYASNFGHYSFINRLVTKLAGDTNANKETVEKACIAVRRQMLREGFEPTKEK